MDDEMIGAEAEAETAVREYLAVPDFKRTAGALNRLLHPAATAALVLAVLTALFLAGADGARRAAAALEFSAVWQSLAASVPPGAFLLFYNARAGRVNATVLALLLRVEAVVFASRRALPGARFFERLRAEYPATFNDSYWRRRALNARPPAARLNGQG